MPEHTLATSTRTVELVQLAQLNDRLAALAPETGRGPITAEQLGLAGARVQPRVLDRAAALVLPGPDRRTATLVLPPEAALLRLLAAGDPRFPRLYGVFAEPQGRRQLPVTVHSRQLGQISAALGFRRHVWGM
jgi:hypothetical protein